MTPPQTAPSLPRRVPGGPAEESGIPAPERRHLGPLWPSAAPTQSRPNYAASDSAAASTTFATAGDAPLIITEAELAASCNDLVERCA